MLVYFWLCWLFVGARGLSLVAESRGLLFSVVPGPLVALASLVGKHVLWGTWALLVAAPWLQGTSSAVVAHRIFPGQGSNPRLLHWQADSLPLSHQGSPIVGSEIV